MLFQCPLPETLANITATDCPVRFDQIQRIIFGRKSSTPRFSTENAITAQASWTALMTATDATKLVGTPLFAGLEIPNSEAIKEGGNDNSTINGVAELKGGSAVTVPFVIKNVSAETAKGLRALCAETIAQPGVTNLVGYFCATDNTIIYDGGKDGTAFNGFEIFNLYVPDVASAGFNQPNTFNCSFELRFGWSENFKIQKLDFDPRSL